MSESREVSEKEEKKNRCSHAVQKSGNEMHEFFVQLTPRIPLIFLCPYSKVILYIRAEERLGLGEEMEMKRTRGKRRRR